MSLIQIINSEHSDDFGQLITDIKANILSYLEARQKAQKERMIIIGKIAEYKSNYPQRSKEHRALTKAMSEEGWSQDVISNNLVAYKQYKNILESHSSWHPLAEAASVSHLVEISRSIGTGLRYDSLQYLKRNKRLPSIKAMRGYLGGFFDEKFQPKFKNKGSRNESFGTPELTTTYTNKQYEPQQPTGSALVPKQREAFEIPLNNGQFVIHQDSTDIEYEKILPTQEKLIQELKLIVEQIDNDKVFVNDALRSQLEPIQLQLEILSDLAKPRSPKPKYI
tara:strand:- start:7093 stop:7932 length:840 start_codon:yes stop_codon:yes gene_type:complete